jgi:hypothetical protein
MVDPKEMDGVKEVVLNSPPIRLFQCFILKQSHVTEETVQFLYIVKRNIYSVYNEIATTGARLSDIELLYYLIHQQIISIKSIAKIRFLAHLS